MCGIIGFNSNSKILGESMCASISHRGPDDSGVFSDESATIGNRRLAIIDLTSSGRQPMSSRDNSLFIVYNGEVYNFKDIKNDLLGKGYKFRSNTDTEAILYGYEHYGKEIFNMMRGMWSLSIYDKRRNELVLARDYFGIKPLYYFWDEEDFCFASEIKAIKKFLAGKNKKLSLSREGVGQYFILGYTAHPYTVFGKIKKVSPGEILSFNLAKKSFHSESLDWKAEEGKALDLSPARALSSFGDIMRNSVEKHIISDVPVGVFLSGGSDSTLIAFMLKKLGANFEAFTVRIEDRNDADYASKIVKFAGLRHNEIIFDKHELEKSYEECWKYLDEPISDSSLLPSLSVSRAASEKVKVVLAGEGGDELFWGYPRHESLSSLNSIFGADNTVKIFDRLRVPDSMFYMRFIRRQFRKIISAHFRRSKNLLGAYVETMGKDFDSVSRLALYDYLYEFFKNKNLDPAFFDRELYLPNNLLYKTDFATMVHSVEARTPFLDKQVFTFSNSLPSSLKLHNKIGKRIVKEYLSENLPPELIFRKKEGFGIPLQLLYESERYNLDIKEAVSFTRDVLDGLGLDSRSFARLSRDEKFLMLFKRMFPRLLFAAVSFHKSVGRILG